MKLSLLLFALSLVLCLLQRQDALGQTTQIPTFSQVQAAAASPKSVLTTDSPDFVAFHCTLADGRKQFWIFFPKTLRDGRADRGIVSTITPNPTGKPTEMAGNYQSSIVDGTERIDIAWASGNSNSCFHSPTKGTLTFHGVKAGANETTLVFPFIKAPLTADEKAAAKLVAQKLQKQRLTSNAQEALEWADFFKNFNRPIQD